MSGVRLPRAVLAAQKASDLAMEQLKNPQAAGDPNTDSGEFVADTDPAFEEGTPEQAAPEATPTAGENEDGNKDDQFPVNWQAEAEAMKEERDLAVTKLQTLTGKYNAEVPRLSDEIRDLKAKIAEASTATPAPAQTAVISAEMDEKISKLKDMYGDDIADVIQIAVSQATGQAVDQAVATTRKEFEPRLSRVDDIESRSVQSQQDTMFDAVEAKHSDWEAINGLATFHRFLAEKQPGTTRTRQEAIDEAVNVNDPDPIIHQLTQFKRRVKRGNSAMESQVVPGDTGRTEPQVTEDSRIYAASDIDAFFKKIALAKSRGPLTDEQNRLESVYTKALRERRVA